ncbi:MAG: hypothetical protein JW940_30670 [Polyangiaceae bacterium]|nr:hypothetical protein [Polyangiaceae bacterium]
MRSSTSRVASLLADLAEALSEFGARWYVFGAQAAIVHGAQRLTADVDVTLDLGSRPVADLLKTLQRRGFSPQIPDPRFIETTRVIPIVHRRSAIPVDLVLAGPGLEDLFFERVQAIRVGARKINFAAPEDLIAMKILSGRPKDIDDIEAILAARRDLDIGVIRETLCLAETLLDQSDLCPTFEQLLANTPRRRPLEAPKHKAPRRTASPKPRGQRTKQG